LEGFVTTETGYVYIDGREGEKEEELEQTGRNEEMLELLRSHHVR
jgi:hypothetical protein